MSTVTIYHNPRCSKSRAALALLEEKGIEPKIIRYLDEPLDEEAIDALLKKLKIDAYDLLRTKEADYKNAALSKDSSRNDIIRAIAQYPKLLERPIVVKANHARIGRPTERILEIL